MPSYRLEIHVPKFLKICDLNGMSLMLVVVNEYGYGIYNAKRSIRNGEFIWEFSEGSIEDYYTPFQERGIVFEKDIYGEIKKRNKQFFKSIREHSYFRTKGLY